MHRHEALADRGRDRAPDEGVGAEAEHEGEGDRGLRREGEGEVHEHLEGEADAHERGERDVLLKPSERDDAGETAQRRGGGERAVADGAHAEVLRRVQDEDAPRCRPGHVEDQDDEHERAYRGIASQPPQALADRTGVRCRRGRRAVRDGRGGRHRCARDPRDQQHGERHAQDLDEERPERPDGEQERAQGRAGELVRDQESGLQPRIAEAQVGGAHEHRQERAAGGVGEHLGGAVEERRDEHGPDGGVPRQQEHDEARHDDGPRAVGDHDEAAAVVVVGDGAGGEAEEQPRQELHHRAGGDEHRRRGERGDQQGSGGQGDAVAEVARPGRGQQPPEVAAQAPRRDDLSERGHPAILDPPPVPVPRTPISRDRTNVTLQPS